MKYLTFLLIFINIGCQDASSSAITKPLTTDQKIEKLQRTIDRLTNSVDQLHRAKQDTQDQAKRAKECNMRCVETFPIRQDEDFKDSKRGKCLDQCPEYPLEYGGGC